MDMVENVVIVGAGISGLATALGLHRKGIRSLVLESSETLRASGFVFTTWMNAWRAMDALGVADSLRQHHPHIQRVTVSSAASGAVTSEVSLSSQGKWGEHECRCVKRNLLLETLARELPEDSIRYSSKVVSIDEDGDLKLLHLADGSTLKTKVLIGCDGVNSLVANWLGFKKPFFSGRSAARGFSVFPNGHGFKPNFMQYFGELFQCGLLPCDEKSIYWFFTWSSPTAEEKEVEEDETKMKQFVLTKMRKSNVAEEVAQVVERSEIGSVISSPLRLRWPFELIWGNISKGNVCVAGDALHPMTPDLGQGGCSALEDGVVLARCLGDALLRGENERGEHERIKGGLEKYAKERRWRSFLLIAASYARGYVQESDGIVMNFVRDKCLSGIMAHTILKSADYDCGGL